jgi:hypothetical protein
VTGSPACFPLTIWADVPFSLLGSGHVDRPSQADFTNATIVPVACFGFDSATPAPSSSEGPKKSAPLR